MPGSFPLIGSKGSIAKKIIEMIPPHQCYVEPFGGSGAVLLTKPRSEVEVYNDINDDIYNFLLQVRDNLAGLQWKIAFTPYSRKLYQVWTKEWKRKKQPTDSAERAARWFFLQCAAINQQFGAGWKHGTYSNSATDYQRNGSRLIDVARRLAGVTLEHEDFAKVIRTYDSPDTCHYVDPPYLGTKREKEYYGSGFTIKRHKELAEILHQIQGKAIVSYYPHPLIDKLYGDWYRHEIDVTKSTGGVNGKAKDKAVELLLSNFEPLPLFRFGGINGNQEFII